MKIVGCILLLALTLPLSAVSESLSDIVNDIVNDPLPWDVEKWKYSSKDFKEIMKKPEVHSAGCSNIAADCRCNFLALLGRCESQTYHVWMKEQCAASCGHCVGESIGSQCQDKYKGGCKKWAGRGLHLRLQFQYFMACKCPTACGICMEATPEPTTTELATTDVTPVTTPKVIDEEECLRLHNEKRSHHGAAPLTWCQFAK
ncbi:uncharacterized protein LOC144916497 [Branchiostoma floridae x Branchiostoma belcheri]